MPRGAAGPGTMRASEEVAVAEAERDALAFHVGFVALAALVLVVGPGTVGWRMVGLVVVYDAGWLAVGWWHRRSEWARLLWFGAVLSLWQVFPDWFLVDLGILRFAPDGVPDIGPVTATMAGLWTFPTVVVVLAAIAVERRRGRLAAGVTAAAVGVVVHAGGAVLMAALGVRSALNVAAIGDLALYLLPAQVLLAVGSYDLFLQTRDRHPAAMLPATFVLMLLYLGAAAFGFLVFEWIPSG